MMLSFKQRKAPRGGGKALAKDLPPPWLIPLLEKRKNNMPERPFKQPEIRPPAEESPSKNDNNTIPTDENKPQRGVLIIKLSESLS